MRAKALLIPTQLSFRVLGPQKGNKTRELANICFHLTVTLRQALGKRPPDSEVRLPYSLAVSEQSEKHKGRVCSPFINPM